MSYLLDTNVLSELVRAKPNKNVISWINTIPNESLHISVFTLGEIRKGIEGVSDSHRKEKLRVWLEVDLPAWFNERILAFNSAIADRWGRLQHDAKRPIAAIDSLIAATALHYDLRLVTRNIKDYSYSSLEVINPWD
jgi:predicted nucleic acid-binding protein